jgi:hypothetical protein
MNQKNYSKNISRSIPKSLSFNINAQYNNILYALLIIIIVFIVVILINYIYHIYQEMRLKQRLLNNIKNHTRFADKQYETVNHNNISVQQQNSQTSQNNTQSKVLEVNIGGNMIPCDILKPCRLLNPPPKDGCCPDGIAAIDKNGPPGNCELGAEYRSSSEYQNALKKCGY